MSFGAQDAALKIEAELTASERLALITLASFVIGDTREACVSARVMGERCGLRRETITRGLLRCEELGLVEKSAKSGRRSHRWRVLFSYTHNRELPDERIVVVTETHNDRTSVVTDTHNNEAPRVESVVTETHTPCDENAQVLVTDTHMTKKQGLKQVSEEGERGRKAPAPTPSTKELAVTMTAAWSPTDDDRDWATSKATEHGLGVTWVAAELEKFRNHHDGDTRRSWNGRFRNWILKGIDHDATRTSDRHATADDRRTATADRWLSTRQRGAVIDLPDQALAERLTAAPCPTCQGTKWEYPDERELEVRRCSACEGTGTREAMAS